MVKKMLKGIGILLGALMGLLVLSVGAAYGVSQYKLNRTYPTPVIGLKIGNDAATIERGKHLATAVAVCVDCHGPDLSGKTILDDPAIGLVQSPNITSGKNGYGPKLSDEDIARVVRFGVMPDGRSARIMSSDDYITLSDADLADIIAYVRSVPPVDSAPYQITLHPLGAILHAVGQVPIDTAARLNRSHYKSDAPPIGPTVEYGHYLAKISGCMGCHNPSLSGGPIVGTPPGYPETSNLTPKGELSAFTEETFMTTVRTGVNPFGRKLNDVMPSKYYKNMTDVELKALWAYIKTIPSKEYAQR